jgi:signal transduction histidine kinase
MNSTAKRDLSRERDAYQGFLIKSSLLRLILMSLSIFLVEMFVHTLFDRIIPLSHHIEALANGLLLVVLLSPMLYYFLFRPLLTHIRRRRLAEEALNVSAEHLRVLSSHLLVAHEEERKRISLELHDALGQSLTFLKLRLRFINNRLSDDQMLLKEECRENLRFVDEVIDNVRRLSRDLSPSILEDLGLNASLNRLIDDFAKYYSIAETSVVMPDLDRFFVNTARIFIYRIFQEALTNISKHSQARHVSIMVNQQDEGSVCFRIEDDGRGFDVQSIIEKGAGVRSLGIVALQQRVRTMGGSFSINSNEGKGTKIAFTLPVEKKGDKDESIQNRPGGRPQYTEAGFKENYFGTG